MTTAPAHDRTTLSVAARITTLVGAAGSLGLWIHASRHPPLVLIILFIGWVLAPYAILVWVNELPMRWPAAMRPTVFGLTVAIALASLAAYGYDAMHPRKAQPAAFYVLVPLLSLIVIAIVLTIARLVHGRRPREPRT